MIRVCLFDSASVSVGGAELISLPLAKGTYIWIDIHNESHAAEESIFDQFGCHPLTIQDARRERHPPKTEHFKDQSFVLLRALGAVSEGLAFETTQIACFIGDNFLITRHDNESAVIDQWLALGTLLLRSWQAAAWSWHAHGTRRVAPGRCWHIPLVPRSCVLLPRPWYALGKLLALLAYLWHALGTPLALERSWHVLGTPRTLLARSWHVPCTFLASVGVFKICYLAIERKRFLEIRPLRLTNDNFTMCKSCVRSILTDP